MLETNYKCSNEKHPHFDSLLNTYSFKNFSNKTHQNDWTSMCPWGVWLAVINHKDRNLLPIEDVRWESYVNVCHTSTKQWYQSKNLIPFTLTGVAISSERKNTTKIGNGEVVSSFSKPIVSSYIKLKFECNVSNGWHSSVVRISD